MYGPPLWFGWATLKTISALLPGVDWLPRPTPPIVPTTVSPTWNTPDDISISSSFGTQYLLTSCPSKNGYNLVNGLTLLETNWIFLDLKKVIKSLLTVLSPIDSLSNCSTIAVLVPVLFIDSDCQVSLSISVTVVLLCVIFLPCLWLWTLLDLVIVRSLVKVPPQLVCHAFHIVPANPFWSTPIFCWASARTEAKLPSLLITLASSLTVSTQLSLAGVNSTVPSQKLTINGVTLSLLVPKDCFTYSTSA